MVAVDPRQNGESEGWDERWYMHHVETLREIRDGYVALLADTTGAELREVIQKIDEINLELFKRGIRD
jgi:hypothetical protein